LVSTGAINVSGSTINIDLTSLSISNFTCSTSYIWTIASGASIIGFNADNFTVSTANFAPGLGGGTFSVVQSGNDINLVFTPCAFCTSYYSKSTGNLNVLGTWGTNTDGTGSAPSDFISNNCFYYIANRTVATLTAGTPWTVSGTNSKVILGSLSVAAITFTIPSTSAFTGTIDIPAASSLSNTLTIQNTTIPTFGTLNAGSTVNYNCTTANQTVTATTYGNLTISCTGYTATLGGAISAARTLSIINGTLTAVNGGNNYVISAGSISVGASGTLNPGSATHLLSGTGTVFDNTAAGTISANTGTLKITDQSNTAITFAGGGKTYNNIYFNRGASTGTNTITGSNTFNDFKDDGTASHSILFTTGSTQTVNTFTVSGTAGNSITINSTTTGTHALVKAGGGTNICDYLNIQHSVVTPACTWFAGENSVNNQIVSVAGSGWLFTAPPSAPVESTPQAFCSGLSPTIASLTTTPGTEIHWYAASSGGTSLATSTALTNGAHYYASQIVNGCESINRFEVTATINTSPSAPTANDNAPIYVNSTLNLTASTISGASYSWSGPSGYTSTSQNPTRSSVTTAMAGSYCVTATVNGCASPQSCTSVSIIDPESITQCNLHVKSTTKMVLSHNIVVSLPGKLTNNGSVFSKNPTTDTDTFKFSGNTLQEITGTGLNTFKNLRITNNVGLQLSHDVTVLG
ncbi:MAG: hypothetical protein HGB12_16110, partial [Bacteroidetes bacterium]|nr:hypothetical protein [Bacteroidota bacterium]